MGKTCPLGIPIRDPVFCVCILFPFNVLGRMWNSSESVPDHCRHFL